MSNSESAPAAARSVLASLVLALPGCSPQISGAFPERAAQANLTIQPVATLQELMQVEVDASADNIWDAVETTTSDSGEQTRQPRGAREWQEIRRSAVVLIEAANLLAMDGRQLSSVPFPAEAVGALDSAEIARRVSGNRVLFNQYAAALRQATQTVLSAIDARDPAALVTAGGALDQVCESCHMTFWYPNQRIPSFPTERDRRYKLIAVNPAR